jgi:hypothetical protein
MRLVAKESAALNSRAAKRRPASSGFLGPVVFEAETILYLLLSVADLWMTHFLLRQNVENLQFVESNPVARYFLDHWGLKGMVYFKFGMVAFIVVLTQIIARYRPFTARLVLLFAILMMIYVVVYSVRLYAAHAGGVMPEHEMSLIPTIRL